jgi:hypothetical protein
MGTFCRENFPGLETKICNQRRESEIDAFRQTPGSGEEQVAGILCSSAQMVNHFLDINNFETPRARDVQGFAAYARNSNLTVGKRS